MKLLGRVRRKKRNIEVWVLEKFLGCRISLGV